jgi:hypothetical protein
MADYITKCSRCGCREFCVTETIEWRGDVDHNGILCCTNPDNSIATMHCAECGAPYSNFATLEFN